MAKDAARVRVALTGTVWIGDTESTAIPASLGAPGAGWTDLGYTSEEGVTFTLGREVEEIPGWQSADPLRIIVTAEPKAVAFTLRQLERSSIVAALGGSVASLGGTPIVYEWTPGEPGDLPVKPLLIDFVDGTLNYRFGFRRSQTRGEVEMGLVRTAAVDVPVEYAALAATPKPWFIRTDDPAFA